MPNREWLYRSMPPKQMYFTSTNSSIPYFAPSRPSPCFAPHGPDPIKRHG